jgi:Mn-dependent DtxR family transcriptional regulator
MDWTRTAPLAMIRLVEPTDPAAAPKVFVSHASEDKQRFVSAFAARLRENGVDAWLDQWEMKPGDSLVDRIFEQGLKSARAVIIVLSAVSVTKPWVREELNNAVVSRISRGLRIIPVVIDDCEIPAALAATLWQRVDDLQHYDAAFQRILDAIFDRSSKPALGQPPERLSDVEAKLPALSGTDQHVLREIYAKQMAGQPAWLSDLAGELSRDVVSDSIEVLQEQSYLLVEAPGDGDLMTQLTTDGFARSAEVFESNYTTRLRALSALLVNEGIEENTTLAARLGESQPFVNFMLDVLEKGGYIATMKYGMGRWEVRVTSPQLKRTLE